MSEHLDEQLSRFIDDEMSTEECEFFVRRLQRDELARASFKRYQLIGAVLRNEHQPFGLTLSARASADTSHEPGTRPRADTARTQPRWRAGLGIAAGLALVAIAGVGLNGLDRNGGAAGDDAAVTAAPGNDPEVLLAAEQLLPAEAEATGLQYLIHHTGYSSGVPRTIMRSGFVAAPMTDLAPNAGAGSLE